MTKEVVKEGSKARPKVTMWLEGTFFDSGSQALLKSQAQDYAQQMGFDLEYVQDATAAMQPRENAAIESQSLPDVLFAGVDLMAKARRAGQLADVTDLVGELNGTMGSFTKAVLTSVSYEGKQYAVPFYLSSEMFYVRQDLMD